MSTANSAAAVKRMPPKPFVKGDPRINREGRRPAVLSKAILAKMTPERADKIADQLLAKAEAGEGWALQMLWDRTEGKVPNRNEDGKPGDFDADLSDFDTRTLKAALKRVK